MAFAFTSIELAIIESLRDAGRFADAYSFVSRRLRGLSVSPGDFPGFVSAPLLPRSPAPDTDPAVNQVELWFAGASHANANFGPFAQLIREYTVRQGLLRYGETFAPSMVQAASDNVARAALQDLLGLNGPLLSIKQSVLSNAA